MEKIRIAFYKAKIDGKYIDNAIAAWTRLWNLSEPKELICSHEELWLPDKQQCWTSTMGQVGGRVGNGGVVCRDANKVFIHPERWFYAEFQACKFSYEEIIFSLQNELDANKGYDKAMILNFFLPFGFGASDKWICSEFVNHHILKARRFLPITTKMSPYRTAARLYKHGIKFYEMNGNQLKVLERTKK